MRRHPAYRHWHGLATGSEDGLAVVHEISEHRGVAPTAKHSEGQASPVTADNSANEFGLAQLTDAIVTPLLRPIIEFWYPIAVGCIENLPRLMPRNPLTAGSTPEPLAP